MGRMLEGSATTSPRMIANELKALQQSFIDAHEQQVHQLLKLLAAAGVQFSPQDGAVLKVTEGHHGPAEECTMLRGRSPLSWDDNDIVLLQAEVEDTKGREAVEAEKTVLLQQPTSLDRGSVVSSAEHDQGAPTQSSINSLQSLSSYSEMKLEGTHSMLAEVDAMEADAMDVTSLVTNSKLEKTGVAQSTRRKTQWDTGIQDLMPTKDKFGGLSPWSRSTGRSSLADRIYSCTEHHSFDLCCGLVIALNAAFMAYETEWALTAQVGAPLPLWMTIVGKAFTAFFIIELLLRMCGGLQRFFCSCNLWNYFDVCIVSFAILEEILHEVANLSNIRMIRLLRLTRTMKVFRTVRLVRMVVALRTLVNSLIGTIKPVIWAFFLIFCLIFVFAVIFGQVVSQARWSDPQIMDEDAMRFFWGDLLSCMYTLYLSVSGGVSWYEPAQALRELGTFVFLGFIMYVALAQWVVLNVITGFFCESAAEAARKDVGLAVQSHRADRDKFLHRCKHIFRTIDADDSGHLEVYEMKPFLDTEPAHTLFAALEIAVDDAKELFDLLDEDGTQYIDLEEFMLGCLRLRGGAKALDLAKLQYQTKNLNRKINAVVESLGVVVPPEVKKKP
eukprot:TRINITY_DN11978_c0_g2_i1.p1 TRINITY_DN11978_c0_g2~~TRINITY_DN11978_c0_g2_i1.p1  ORF type:complete len:614 (+),score=69.74 TRINITY_DN11978_c0_g2_i1:174-2015(+)